MGWIREYFAEKYTSEDNTARVYVGGAAVATGLTRCTPIPTLEEVSANLGEEITRLRLNRCFYWCYDLLTAPRIDFDYVVYGREMFYTYSYSSLRIAPKLINDPANSILDGMFMNCTNLISPPTIHQKPSGYWSLSRFLYGCSGLKHAVSIPPKVKYIDEMFSGCTNISGEMIVRPTSLYGASRYEDALKDTTKTLILYGDKSICEAIAATANNGNASWSAWYQPVPAVTNRGQGSYTTAEDMTRMVRNGALAVNTYAPGRMVYHQGDIVRADEWQALVEAAQTIDPTVTLSTNYANLNRIEAAFDSAL